MTPAARWLAAAVQRGRIACYGLLSDNRRVTGRPVVLQPVLYVGRGAIVFEGTAHLGYFPSPGFYAGYGHLEARHPHSEIRIGDNVRANNNLVVICEARVTIGPDALIGTNVEITDSDFHGVDPARRRGNRHEVAPVTIGRNVWIGSNARILKGVTIGDNSVIGNGSVVTRDVPADVVAAGVPARVIRPVHG